MKQKILNCLKFGILVFGISLVLFNCQTDNSDELISTPKGENSFLKKGKLADYNQLSTYVEELKNRRTSTNDNKKSSLEDINGFDILYDQDMFIQEVDSSVTFSIPIHKNNQLGGTFSNLVVRFSDTEPTEALILNYYPNNEYIDAVALDNRTPFAGSISSELVDYDGSLDNLKINKSNALDCIIVTTKYCDYENGRHGAVHLGGDNCTPGFYWYVTSTVCHDDVPTLADIPTPGSGNPSASDYIDYATAGGGISSGGGTVHPPIVVPSVPRTYSGLNIDGLSIEMTDWLNRSENREFKNEMMDFLLEADPLTRNELEAYLMLKSESSQVPWSNSSGYFNNISTLGFTHLRHMSDAKGYIYTEFKLTNGDIIMRGDFSETNEPRGLTFYYDKASKRLFEIPEPYNTNPSVNLDFLWDNFWSTVQTGLRYCTPLEDVVILIDGKDFDGVESSRAISGLMLLVEITPIGKVFKIVKKSNLVITNTVPLVARIIDDVFALQQRLFKKYKGLIANMDNALKGRWAEMGTDVDMLGKGYEARHTNRITSIDHGGHPGVDHVFQNPLNGEYVIVETKYKPSGNMAYTNAADDITGLPRQMSDEWLNYNDNLVNSVGDDLANEILNSNYIKLAAIVNPDGTITYRRINELGVIMSGESGIFYP